VKNKYYNKNVVALTGAGGFLMSNLAAKLVQSGWRVALLDVNSVSLKKIRKFEKLFVSLI